MKRKTSFFKPTQILVVICLIVLFGILLVNCSEDNPVEPARPDLVVWPQEIYPSTSYNGPEPNFEKIKVDCSPHDQVSFSLEEDCDWLELSRSDDASVGITQDSFSVSFDTYGMAVGIYVDSIIVLASGTDNSPQFVEVTLTIGPWMDVTPSTLSFVATPEDNQPAAKTLNIISTDGGSFGYTVEGSVDWLELSQTSGTTPGEIEVSVDISKADLGIQVDTLYVRSNEFLNSTRIVLCSLSLPVWGVQPSPLACPLEDVVFADELTGWAVGYILNTNAVDGYVIRTQDAGVSWETILFLTAQTGDSLGFAAIENHGEDLWIVGQSGAILHSPDRGDSWEYQSTGLADTMVTLYDVCFVSPTVGWIVGGNGLILKTIDGGASWGEQSSGVSSNLYCACFIDELTGWTAGAANTIRLTVDGGETWLSVSTGFNDYRGIFFVDGQTGWVVGKQGKILHTSDGGANWIEQSSSVSVWLNSVIFINGNEGWAVGYDGVVLHTEDGGSMWEQQDAVTDEWLHSVYFCAPGVGWAVGDDGVIISTSWGAI